MIVVSGTGRSGTSMWMQVLGAAGYPVLGEAFPLDWESRWAEANPRGFYESSVAGGIHLESHPDPSTGATLDPDADVVAKIFLAGLIRTRFAYLRRVVVSVRQWRAFAASRIASQALLEHPPPSPSRALLRWWAEHRAAVLDSVHRGYPIRFVAYEAVLADPPAQVSAILEWLGHEGDREPAIAAVEPSLRTRADVSTPEDVDPRRAAAADALYERLVSGPVDAGIVEELHADHRLFADALAAERVDPWKARSVP